MSVLIKKEIRLLLPGWCAVLLLETVLPWLYNDADFIFSYTPVAFFLGLIILTVDSFGREFSLGTFQSLMAQPIERQRIWRTKIALLLVAAVLVMLAHLVSCGLRVHNAILAQDSVWRVNSHLIQSDFHQAMLASLVLLVVALTGGLWTSLLLRQTAPAFWVTFLFPTTVVMLLVVFLPKKLAENEHWVGTLLYVLAAVYSVGSFLLAHRLFYRAQDVGWGGGLISFSRWRYFERGAMAGSTRREYRPFTALLKKEFQLHSVSLICVGGLLAVHIVAFIVRAFYGTSNRDSMVNLMANGFWVFWMIVPVVIGCTAAAEERKLGVMNEQFCLPASRFRQFMVKFVPTFFWGVFLGGVMPILLETIAGSLGTPNEFFKPGAHQGNDFFDGYDLFLMGIMSAAIALSLLGIWASTLAKNFLQALSLTIVGCVLFGAISQWAARSLMLVTPLPILFGIPVTLVTVLWLSWRNFSDYQEASRMLWRNILGIIGGVALVAAVSYLIYERAWELVGRAEPPHGPAKYSLANRPKLEIKWDGEMLVRASDGRVWYDNLGMVGLWDANYYSGWRYVLARLTPPSMNSTGPRAFVDGSNWVSVATQRLGYTRQVKPGTFENAPGYLDTVGVKGDGTLWISSKSQPEVWGGDKMRQVGSDTNWLKVVHENRGYVLQKADGTLWWWGLGTNNVIWNPNSRTNWPTVRDSTMEQIGTNSDWKELVQSRWPACRARKSDGTVWSLVYQPNEQSPELKRQTNFDDAVLATVSSSGDGSTAYIGTDGRLRLSLRDDNKGGFSEFTSVGSDTNWVAVQLSWNWMAALKSDGTLWKWNLPDRIADDNDEPRSNRFDREKPVRLGDHSDWIGLSDTGYAIVALAADGTLWSRPGTDHDEFALMRTSRKPQLLGTVFSGSN